MSAFVPTVEPWAKKAISLGSMSACSSAAMIAAAGSAGIEAVLAIDTRPDFSSWTIRSVNVPPTSTATRYWLMQRIPSRLAGATRFPYGTVYPPSIVKIWPVTKSEASDAR